jgi:hypothetical protein
VEEGGKERKMEGVTHTQSNTPTDTHRYILRLSKEYPS